ncbi:class C sortase [Bifidobacterium sp. ESL0764]|uniref:class C sortase n=1 Tax=Bifidobacterium sp. ESL0764 TaxID=2983228 RepID=UPI0023F92344|nr:class C sortase [Bifidobacterium sp. ESL0764]WEV65411.1 class C sortase [Bifidobacterium sp. ESL0764]
MRSKAKQSRKSVPERLEGVGRERMASSFSQIVAAPRRPKGAKSIDLMIAGIKAVAVLMLLVGVCIFGYPFAAQTVSTYKQAESSNVLSGKMDANPDAAKALADADEYNRELAASGQQTIGMLNPYTDAENFGQGVSNNRTSGSGTSRNGTSDNTASDNGERHNGTSNNAMNDAASDSGESDAAATNDKRYMSLLNEGAGMMGVVVIPKISVDLPIYHGTALPILQIAAGHLHGTSLPVGGASTHAVIAAHNGMTKALMFTRLDEMKKRDVFYVKVPGRKLGYRVDRISLIRPDDDSKLKVEPGVDRVTLMTCFPYGINDHRLLVSGVRDHALDKTYPNDYGRRMMAAIAAVLTALALAVIGIAASIVRQHRHRVARSRHAARH